MPRQLLNFSGEYQLDAPWSVSGNLRASSGQFAVGDENNRDRHGALGGYAVLALDVHYQATRRLALFARVDNALDRRYAISGQLGRHSIFQNLPARKSAMASWICSGVFITNGP